MIVAFEPKSLSAEGAAKVKSGYCVCGSTYLLRGPAGVSSGRNYLCMSCHKEYQVSWNGVWLLHELCPVERTKEVYRL